MGLLAPWFLAGALAVALPVWLHLLRRRYSPPREFSSLMFFERRQESSVRRRRLRYLLLLALRCLLLLALALAFARPYRETAAAGAGGGRLVILALDESFSMRQGDRMARAKEAALAQLARLGPGDRLQVIAFSGAVRRLAEEARQRQEARAAIESLQATDSRSSYAELARALRTIAEAARRTVEAHVFTDAQRSSLPADFRDLSLPGTVRLRVHSVADRRLDNWTVEGVDAPPAVYSAAPVRVQATLAGFAREAAKATVSLVIEGRLVERKQVEVPAGGRAAVEFTAASLRHGVNRGEVRLEPGDAFPEDDLRRFAVERADPRPALFVREARDRRSWLYFRTALESSPQNAFRLEESVAESAADLNPARYAFVVLSDPGWLPASFASALRTYLEKGGGVWMALGPAALARGRAPLPDLPVKAGGPGSGSFQSVWYLDPAHSVTGRSGRWQGVKFYQAAVPEVAEARVLARLADRTPLLVEKTVGAGRLLIFSSTFDNLANDMPLYPCFVPFIERAAAYLGGLEDAPGPLTVDAHLPLRTAADGGTAVEVIAPGQRRALSLAEATTAQSLPLKHAGYYEVRRGNGRNQTVAVNPDPRESDLALIPSEMLALWNGAGGAGEVAVSGQSAEPARQGWWQWVLLAALLAAAAESFVANRYLGRESEGA